MGNIYPLRPKLPSWRYALFVRFNDRLNDLEKKLDKALGTWSSRPGFYWILFTVIISSFLTLEKYYQNIISWLTSLGFWDLRSIYPDFITNGDRYFNINFIEWFGVFYGFLIPTVLVKVWEQFDSTGRAFDREVDVVRILFGDVQLLDDHYYLSFKIGVLDTLLGYTAHVKDFYDQEQDTDKQHKSNGDTMLSKVRTLYNEFKILHPKQKTEREADPLLSELINQLNNIVDIRGDRIALSRQRLFQGLRVIVLASSVIWLLPFYFIARIAPDLADYGLFTDLLKLGVTVLVIFVLSIIEDLDEPFEGTWRIGPESWEQLHKDISEALESLKKDKPGIILTEKKSSRVKRK